MFTTCWQSYLNEDNEEKKKLHTNYINLNLENHRGIERNIYINPMIKVGIARLTTTTTTTTTKRGVCPVFCQLERLVWGEIMR